MKKNNKNIDICNLIILTLIFIGVILLVIRNKYIWGSSLDWIDQATVIPEYFRTLFYDTHNLFPNLALNLGSGQNIYNFAYYGLLNPIIIISYLMPFINMTDYIIYSSIILVYISMILFYYFIKSNNYSSKICFISSLLFVLASPLLFHSHRHIMFINYMPVLLLALFAVDKYFKKNNKWLLSLSVLLIILISYYYSISSILCIIIYGVYKYIKNNKKISFKMFVKDGLLFLIPIIIGILMAGILLFPEVLAIFNGRMSSVVKVDFFDLFFPTINCKYILYNSYGLGLTSIALISLISIFKNNKRENIFLGMVLSLLIIFPIFNYIFNALMYIDFKVFIPLLPLYVLCISIFFKDLEDGKLDLKYIIVSTVIISLLMLIFKSYYYLYVYIDILLTIVSLFLSVKYNKKIIYIFLCVIAFGFSIFINLNSRLVPIDEVSYKNYDIEKELVNNITTEDKNMYKITTVMDKNHTANTIFSNIDMYHNYLYSSVYNINYNKFYYDVFNNPMQARNRILTTSNTNIMFLMYMNSKYLIGDNLNLFGYNLYETKNGINTYINEDVLPYMYVGYNTYNMDSFNNVVFPYNNEILLNNVVIKDSDNSNFLTNIKELKITEFDYKKININNNNGIYEFNANENDQMIIQLPEEAHNKIIFIKFKMNKNQSCRIGDQSITINNVTNILTCKSWKYYNGNEEFTYVINEKNIDKLTVAFSRGYYAISDIEFYYMDYNNIKNINKSVTEIKIDKNKTKGDYIYGSVDAIKKGYVVTNIPYQKGFSIFVDSKKITYENVNNGFIGFKIENGKHNIIFKYKSPGKNFGIIISVIGIILFGLIIISDKVLNKRN